jgi:hypothetical protein
MCIFALPKMKWETSVFLCANTSFLESYKNIEKNGLREPELKTL